MATCGLGRWAKGLYLFSGCSDFPASGPPSWARAWKVTGMVISADWVADLGNGASTVSVPSGDREEETRVGSTPGGSLDGHETSTRSLIPGRELFVLHCMFLKLSHFLYDLHFFRPFLFDLIEYYTATMKCKSFSFK